MATRSRTILVLGLSVVGSIALAAELGEKFAADVPQKTKPRITISTETTRITEPLRTDGYVNYVAALNQRLSQGVTPDNNSAVLMIQAFGPGEIPQKIREQYFKMLGISPLPDEGPYLVAFDDYAERARKAAAAGKESSEEERAKSWDDLDAAMSRPWSKESLPTVAAWMEASERPLALVLEATKRPRKYDPLIAIGDLSMSLSVLPLMSAYRHAARALRARAMFKLNAGKVEDAWQDLLACHRLGRLIGQGGTIVDALVAIAIDGVACIADQTLLAHGNLTAAQARQMYDDLQKLPPLPKMADAIDLGERYIFLDCVQTLADRGLGEIDRIVGGIPGEGGDESNAMGKFLSTAGALVINWDVILRMSNTWYDRLVAAHRKPTWTERSAAMGEIDAELAELSKNAKDVKLLALSMLGGPRHAISERVGQILVALLVPAVNACTQAEARGAESFEVLKLGFPLAAYRAENGKYPAQLVELSPKYLAEMPPDPFTGKPLIYKRRQDGYFLYSVGVNGKDDGGLSYDDRWTARDLDQDYDDLVVQVPLKQREQQPQ